jgi:hypothetical protein
MSASLPGFRDPVLAAQRMRAIDGRGRNRFRRRQSQAHASQGDHGLHVQRRIAPRAEIAAWRDGHSRVHQGARGSIPQPAVEARGGAVAMVGESASIETSDGVACSR